MGVVDLSGIKVKQNSSVELKPVTYEQVLQAGDDYYHIPAGTSRLVKEINDIDSRLHVKYSTLHDFFVLYAIEEDRRGKREYLVKTFKSLDSRIVERVKEISSPDYDFVKELEDDEKKLDNEKLYAIEQKIGDGAERLASALRRGLGYDKGSAFFPDRSVKRKLTDGKDFLGGVRSDG